MTEQEARWAGLATVAVAGSALMWGLWWLPLRSLQDGGLGSFQVNLSIYLPLAVVALPYLWRRWNGGLKDHALPFLVAAVLMGLALLAWNLALLWGEVVRVSLLFYLTPIWASLLSVIFLNIRFGPLRAATVLCGLSGAIVVLSGHAEGLPLPRETADWLALGSGILFAGSLVTTRRWPAISGLPLTLSTFVVVALGSSALVVSQEGLGTLLSLSPWLLLAAALVGVLWILPAMWLILWGAGRLDAGRISIILLLEIPVAAVSATLIAQEPFGWREAAGCLLVLLAGALESRGEAIERRVFS